MAKIIDFSDNFAIFLKLLDEKVAAREFETAISVTVKKLEETGKTFFGELLKHRLSELYIPIGAYEENIALLAELAGEAGRSEYLTAIRMLYREMCVAGRRITDVYGEKPDVEYLLAQAASGDLEALWDDYAFTFERESGEPVRIDVSVRNDLKNFSEAAELLAAGDPEGAVAVADCVSDDSVVAELALSVKAEAAADAGDYELAEKAARKLYAINPSSRTAAEVILKCALEDFRFSEEFAKLLAAYKESKNAVELAEISRTAMLNGYMPEAYAAAKAAVAADKYYYEGLAMLALTATAAGDNEEGLKALYRGMRMYPRCNRLAMAEVVIKEYYNGDVGTLRSAAAGIVITASLVSLLVPVIELLESFSRSAGLENYFPILLKSLGIALICTLTADICRDCGEPGIASKVELGGKIGILLCSVNNTVYGKGDLRGFNQIIIGSFCH